MHIDFAAAPRQVLKRITPWRRYSGTRRACPIAVALGGETLASAGVWLCQNRAMGSETVQTPRVLPHLWKSSFALAATSVVLGAAVLAWPQETIGLAVACVGLYLLAVGLAQFVFAFGLQAHLTGRILPLMSGVVAVALAVLSFLSIRDSVLLLAIWIGLGLTFRGVTTPFAALGDPTLPGRPWTVVMGVVSLVAGVVLLAAPILSLAPFAKVVGIWLVVIGSFEFATAFAVRRALKVRATSGPHGAETSVAQFDSNEPKVESEDVVPSPASTTAKS